MILVLLKSVSEEFWFYFIFFIQNPVKKLMNLMVHYL
jgi:hypothetical protein